MLKHQIPKNGHPLSVFKLAFLALYLGPLLSLEISLEAQEKKLPQGPPLIERGENLLREGKYEPAIDEFTTYLKSAPAQDANRLRCYWNLGILFWNIDRLDDAEKNFRQADKLAGLVNLPKKRAECETALQIHDLFTQANDSRHRGNISQSNQYFKDAVALARSIKSQAHELKILRTWSTNYIFTDAGYMESLKLNKEALLLARSLKHGGEILKSQKNIGLLYTLKKEYSQALSSYFQVLDSARDLHDDQETMSCLNNIATLYSTLGDDEKSIAYYSEALKIQKSLGNLSKFSALFHNLGFSYQNLFQTTGNADHWHQAIRFYQESLTLAQKSGDGFLESLSMANTGNAYAYLQKYDEALQLLKSALDMALKRNDASLIAPILASIGTVFIKKGDFSNAESSFNRALKEARKLRSDLLAVRLFFGLAQCRERYGDYGPAISYYNECLKNIEEVGSRIVDDISRASYTQDKTQIYQRLIDLYYNLFLKTRSSALEKEIFSVAERAKARSFVEYLGRLRKRGNAPISGRPNPQEEKLKRSRLEILRHLSSAGPDKETIASLETQLRLIDDQLNTIQSNLFQQTEISERLAKPLPLEVIQKKLPRSDTALIEYMLGNDASYLIFISNASYHVVKLPSQDKITNMLAGYLGFLEDPKMDPQAGITAAKRLYREFFYPVESFIPRSVTNLVIVPDGPLFHLPFETLISDHGTDSKPDYLAARYLVSYAPSASAFFYLLQKPKPKSYPKDLLAFGAPTYSKPETQGQGNSRTPSQILMDLYKNSGFSMTPTPFSAQEVKFVSRFFPAGKRDVFIKKNASEQTLKTLSLEDYRIVHFACHAFSDEGYPLRSALVFSLDGGGEEDGFFQVLEMYPLRLNAELTVLSACQTGKGKNIQNEGVLGLPRVFFYMGSRSVISTLWSIHDKATVQFMRYFYESYAQGMGKARALQSAKLKMMGSKYSHPFYWGAFILTGEP